MEIKAGRMMVGKGWTRNLLENFLGKNVNTIPCGSVRKGDDPQGRIVHDFNYAPKNGESVN